MNTLKIAKPKPKSAINAKKIALEVARELEIADILLGGVLDRSTVINKYAVQNIGYFWDRESEQGFVILSNLMQEIKPVHHFTAINRSVRALRNGLNISAYIFFRNYRFLADAEQMAHVRRLQALWKPVIETLLYYHPETKRWFLRPVLEFALSSFVLYIVLSLLGNVSIRSSWNPDEARAFFRLPINQKKRLQNLLHLMNPDYIARIEDFRSELRQAAQEGDPLTSYIVEQGLVLHHFYRKENTLSLIRELYDVAMVQKPPNIFAGAMMHGAFTLADNLGREVDEQALECYRDMIVEYYDNVEDLLLKGHRGKYVPNNLGGYARLYYRLHNTSKVDLLEKYGDRVKQECNQSFVNSFFYDIKGLVADPVYLPIGLASLQQIINVEDPSIRDRIVNFLAQIRVRHPEKLDMFFNEVENSLGVRMADLRRQVETKEIEEYPGDPLRPHTLAMELEALRTPALWKEIYWVIELICKCRSLEQCAQIMVKKMVNIVYGSDIFDLKDSESQ